MGHCCCSCCRFRGAYHLMLSSCLCFSHLFVSSHRSSSNSICHQPGVGIVFSMLTRYFSFYKHQVTTNMSSTALRKTKSCSTSYVFMVNFWMKNDVFFFFLCCKKEPESHFPVFLMWPWETCGHQRKRQGLGRGGGFLMAQFARN